MSKIKLFCFPYAGGSAAVFNQWKEVEVSNIEIIPIELPGRGTRFGDSLIGNMEELIDDIIKNKEFSTASPYAIYGHSLGAWISYHLTKKILNLDLLMPREIFISGKEAPNIKKAEIDYHTLNSEEFKEKIYDLGGTPLEILQNDEIMELFLPILQNDYKVVETYHPENYEVLNCPITIFNGTEDNLNEYDLNEWKNFTNDLDIFEFPGNHFFINDCYPEILRIIDSKIEKGGPNDE